MTFQPVLRCLLQHWSNLDPTTPLLSKSMTNLIDILQANFNINLFKKFFVLLSQD
jgi:hypothetical protein